MPLLHAAHRNGTRSVPTTLGAENTHMQKNPTRDEMLQLVKDAVTSGEFSRATFAGATRGAACEWVRVVVRP